jgi:hypothetical protein
MIALLLLSSLGIAIIVAPPAGASKTKRAENAAVRLWVYAHEAVFTSLQTDIKAVAASIENGSITRITSDCDQLAADVRAASLIPRIPDAEIQGRWSTALRDFGTAADDCTRGVIRNDTRLTAEYGPKVRAGIKQTDAVVKALKKLE